MQTAISPTVSTLAILGSVQLESLTISPDAMPHHYLARAVILDLQPSQMVAAIMAVEDAIRATYPRMHRSGWSATSDGLRIHFHQWTPITTREWVDGNN
jgi:hypothetical protein